MKGYILAYGFRKAQSTIFGKVQGSSWWQMSVTETPHIVVDQIEE